MLSLFEQLGLSYLGPVDGHDVVAVEAALRKARDLAAPTVVHCVTRKGFGHPAAEADEAEKMHAIGPAGATCRQTWTDVFSTEMLAVGRRSGRTSSRSVAAMLGPTGLSAFAARYPDRTFDVGIAEQHAITSAAGLAMGGLHPVVAVYSTFLNRGFDQVADGCGAARHAGDVRARSGRDHRHRRPLASRHVGPDPAGYGARHAGRRAARRHPRSASCFARPPTMTAVRARCDSRRRMSRPRSRRHRPHRRRGRAAHRPGRAHHRRRRDGRNLPRRGGEAG